MQIACDECRNIGIERYVPIYFAARSFLNNNYIYLLSSSYTELIKLKNLNHAQHTSQMSRVDACFILYHL